MDCSKRVHPFVIDALLPPYSFHLFALGFVVIDRSASNEYEGLTDKARFVEALYAPLGVLASGRLKRASFKWDLHHDVGANGKARAKTPGHEIKALTKLLNFDVLALSCKPAGEASCDS